MKKFKFILSAICCLLCAFIFVACKDNNQNGNDNPGNTPKSEYSITLETSTEYTISCDKTTSKPFEQVNVSVALHTIDKKIARVMYGKQIATKNSDGTFKFYMPREDTKVSVVLSEFKEQLKSANSSNAFISFHPENKTTLYPNTGNIKLFVPIKDAPNMTILETKIYSSNQTAIPQDAISVEKVTRSDGNIINSSNIVIDTTKVSTGYSWIEIEFKNGNTTSQKGTLVFKLTIDETIKVDTWKETLEFDLSFLNEDDYKDATFRVSLSDFDYSYGMDCKGNQYYADIVAENGKFKITMDYAISHKYSIYVRSVDKNGNIIKEYNVQQTIGSGDEETGYNQYSKRNLSFVTENYTLTLKLM